MLCPTWKKWWELTGDDTRRQVVIQGGKTMATRFNTKGKYLRSFLAPDSNFIDIMMNVGIIALAGLETNDQRRRSARCKLSSTVRPPVRA